MENAIKKAIEGGYEKGKMIFNTSGEIRFTANPELFFLDPLFWQALIPKEKVVTLSLSKMTITSVGRVPMQRSKQTATYVKKTPNAWKKEWHNFIDHLAENKPADDFFNQLLK